MGDPRIFVIIGAGQAGAWIARTLRTEGFAGRIVLIGAEAHLPYERPPLSKSILNGQTTLEAVTLLHRNSMLADSIEFIASDLVVALDAAARNVYCASGLVLHYDKAFLTTGAHARTLPGLPPVDSPRVHSLRNIEDAWRLCGALRAGGHLVVIGGGWIGLEVAATARAQGMQVTVLEAASRLCARSVPEPVSAFLAALHDQNGVTIHTNVLIQSVTPQDRHVLIETSVGLFFAAQLVLGIGIEPATELARMAGLTINPSNRGIAVDASGRTSDPAIFAAGDVTSHDSLFAGGPLRLESWAHAQNQAIVAAKAALGQDVSYTDIPWAWSDQYACNIQILGLPERGVRFMQTGAMDTSDLTTARCWLALDQQGGVAGAVAVNDARTLRTLRKTLQQRSRPDLTAWVEVDVAVDVAVNVAASPVT